MVNKENPLLLLLVLYSLVVILFSMSVSQSTDLYVVPSTDSTDDVGDGSLTHPYSTIQQALDKIEREYYHRLNSTSRTTIHMYPTYHFVNSLHFTQTHSHSRLTTMSSKDIFTYEKVALHRRIHKKMPTATISGGVRITQWTQVNENTYTAVVPSLTFVNQLFVNNQRIVRTRIPTNYSDYLHYVAPLNDSNQARYGFQYAPGQFDNKSLADAMVVIYHSWTESHHYIDRLITTNNTILFTNPSDRPIGTYPVQAQRRFHIENVCEALIPNSFCFVNQTKTVYLMTNGTYNPNDMEMITPVNDIVLLLAGDNFHKPVEDVIVDNVTIQHGAWNIGPTEQADGADAAFLKNAAFFVANATSITISNVEISHTGSYGLWINTGTSDINFMNSIITDIGAGGI